MAQIHRLHDLEFRGKDFHLIDSFEGLSELTPADAIGTRDIGNSEQQFIFGYEKAFFFDPPGIIVGQFGSEVKVYSCS